MDRAEAFKQLPNWLPIEAQEEIISMKEITPYKVGANKTVIHEYDLYTLCYHSPDGQEIFVDWCLNKTLGAAESICLQIHKDRWISRNISQFMNYMGSRKYGK